MGTQSQATETKQTRPRIRVSKVTLEGFKAFKEPFTFEIPPPLAVDDPDVIVIGSSNGLGKTSLLEGICLGMLGRGLEHIGGRGYDLLINAAVQRAEIRLAVALGDAAWAFGAELNRGVGWGGLGPSRDAMVAIGLPQAAAAARQTAIAVVTGRDDNPVIAPPVLYFHSYRKVPTANLDLAQLTGSATPSSDEEPNVFKFTALTALLAKANLLEDIRPSEASDRALSELDSLLGQFAGVHTEKLKIVGKRLQIRVAHGGGGPSMPFDALSSGQKEIISTLFLIWEVTRGCPSVVLIDEPELHLHSEWHDDIMRMLFELAPWNQYIIATHSQRIARSVGRDRLRILKPQVSAT